MGQDGQVRVCEFVGERKDCLFLRQSLHDIEGNCWWFFYSNLLFYLKQKLIISAYYCHVKEFEEANQWARESSISRWKPTRLSTAPQWWSASARVSRVSTTTTSSTSIWLAWTRSAGACVTRATCGTPDDTGRIVSPSSRRTIESAHSSTHTIKL